MNAIDKLNYLKHNDLFSIKLKNGDFLLGICFNDQYLYLEYKSDKILYHQIDSNQILETTFIKNFADNTDRIKLKRAIRNFALINKLEAGEIIKWETSIGFFDHHALISDLNSADPNIFHVTTEDPNSSGSKNNCKVYKDKLFRKNRNFELLYILKKASKVQNGKIKNIKTKTKTHFTFYIINFKVIKSVSILEF